MVIVYIYNKTINHVVLISTIYLNSRSSWLQHNTEFYFVHTTIHPVGITHITMTETSHNEITDIQVKFITHSCPAVPSTLFTVPSRLSRYGLSEIINYLLHGDDKHNHIPYDILINGQFLRTSLGKYIKNNSLSVVCTKCCYNRLCNMMCSFIETSICL